MLLIISVISMIMALMCYSAGVWGEKLSGRLSLRHLAFFWTGLVFDTTGTTIMGVMSKHFILNIHGVTGLAAIILMILHALWATYTLVKKNEKAAADFHKFSLVVWILWLIPFFTGMILNM